MAALIPPDSSVLDVGCGDGLIDSIVQELRPDIKIRGIDILPRDSTHIPVEIFDGATIPLEDSSFDVVSFVDVLHHVQDPLVLLKEAKRVSSRYILIKDHLVEGLFARHTLRLMDWVGNDRYGVSLPYNYWSQRQWQRAFEELGLEKDKQISHLNLYPYWLDWVFGRSLHFFACLRFTT